MLKGAEYRVVLNDIQISNLIYYSDSVPHILDVICKLNYVSIVIHRNNSQHSSDQTYISLNICCKTIVFIVCGAHDIGKSMLNICYNLS